MTVYMPPIARKKKVDERYNPDSFRVISTAAEDTHPSFNPEPYRASFQPPTPVERIFPEIDCRRTRVLPKALPDFRANNPHPKSCSFIRTDVRLLNDPVCMVHTRETDPEQHSWWPARANKGTLEKGDHTQDTIYRNDFLYTKEAAPAPTFRHSANPNTEPSKGIAPVNFLKGKGGKQGFYQEGLSYEHQYNSRTANNYPIRAKRQGAFVYTKMDPRTTQKLIEMHTQQDLQPSTKMPSPRDCMERVSSPTPVQQNSSPPISHTHSAPTSQRVPKSTAEVHVHRPEMMSTISSPVEFYDPTGRTVQ